ncbi:hypothetical protein KG089_05940 [Carnobacteriaceae bacterium zg-ZUI252]|nr:hypothetical protein [Carnobacteriaceae bacterium zg-ZUI252]
MLTVAITPIKKALCQIGLMAHKDGDLTNVKSLSFHFKSQSDVRLTEMKRI